MAVPKFKTQALFKYGQVVIRLKERKWKIGDEHLQFQAANYMARVTLSSLEELFSNAKEVMNWLSQCARISSAAGKPVAWITPLGLPVVQPYHSVKVRTVKTVLQVAIEMRTTC